MKRIERAYCEIMQQMIKDGIRRFTQKHIAKECGISIGTVNYALKPLHQMGVIEKRHNGFTLINPKKLLIYWASIRNFGNEIVYSTYSKESVRKIELKMPPCSFTAYSGYRYAFDSAPADYGEVYVYCDIELVKKRFPPTKSKIKNVFVLEKDPYIKRKSENGIAPISLIYVDLWNLNKWYADEFLKEMDRRMGL